MIMYSVRADRFEIYDLSQTREIKFDSIQIQYKQYNNIISLRGIIKVILADINVFVQFDHEYLIKQKSQKISYSYSYKLDLYILTVTLSKM